MSGAASSSAKWGKPHGYHARRVWIVPTLWILLSMVMGVVISRANLRGWLPDVTTTLTPDIEVPVLSSIAAGMMALTAIVFSLAFVFVQFGSSAYSPRLVSLLTTHGVMTHSLGVFTGTFMFALIGLILLNPDRPPITTVVVLVVSMVWLLASIALFILLNQRVNLLTISNVLHMIGERGRRVIAEMYPPLDSQPLTPHERAVSAHLQSQLPAITQTLRYHGGPAVVVEFHLDSLVALATRADAMIEMRYAVGDTVTDGSEVLFVRGGKAPIDEHALRSVIALGFERTIEQDPKYALRLLVDVGIKALSPAVNDPTTAVMAMNEIADLVGRIGRRHLDIGYVEDASGAIRLVYPTPKWEDFLSLAIDEIRFYGANSYQVMRRLHALLTDLEQIVPPERRAAIRQQIHRAEQTVTRTFADASDLLEAQQSDRQGIGLSRPDQNAEPGA